MGLYKYLRKTWKEPEKIKKLYRDKLVKWRKEPVILKLERPTRLDRARSLGYKAKQGFFVVRVRLGVGKRKRERIKKGRRSKHARHRKIVGKSYQWVAEGRAAKKYKNCEVLNSYKLFEDPVNKWFEIIMVDINHPVIKADKRINWIINEKKRALKGKTSAGKKSRNL